GMVVCAMSDKLSSIISLPIFGNVLYIALTALRASFSLCQKFSLLISSSGWVSRISVQPAAWTNRKLMIITEKSLVTFIIISSYILILTPSVYVLTGG